MSARFKPQRFTNLGSVLGSKIPRDVGRILAAEISRGLGRIFPASI